MITRYQTREMAELWTDRHKLDIWQEIEARVLEALELDRKAPRGTADEVRAAGPVDLEAWRERERITNHDVVAFVDVLADAMRQGGEWLHFGLTSSDIIDTGNALILQQATDLTLGHTAELFKTLRRMALAHRDTEMVGRTHGVWAEPITFGFKLAGWAQEVYRNHCRLVAARDSISVGKLSGAVGTYSSTGSSLEERVLAQLGLVPEPASTQVVARDRYAHLVSTLAIYGCSLERFATEVRHLQRSEVQEVLEPFADDQKGSSAMPHKRNPILSERITGLARLLRSYSVAALEDVPLWHERDISHSSVERVILPDAFLVLDYALVEFTKLMERLVVDKKRMKHRVEQANGLVYSQPAMLAMIQKTDSEGRRLSRDQAYRIVQKHAMAVWESIQTEPDPDKQDHLLDRLKNDPRVPLTAEELSDVFGKTLLARMQAVFDRLESLELDESTARAPHS